MNKLAFLAAWTQALLAVFYGLMFLTVTLILIFKWTELDKSSVALLAALATGFMNQSSSAGTFWYARHRPQTPIDSIHPTTPEIPASTGAK